MNKPLGLMMIVLIFLPLELRAERKPTGRHPASVKTTKEHKKTPDKKVHDHYVEHMFNQASESPSKIKDY